MIQVCNCNCTLQEMSYRYKNKLNNTVWFGFIGTTELLTFLFILFTQTWCPVQEAALYHSWSCCSTQTHSTNFMYSVQTQSTNFMYSSTNIQYNKLHVLSTNTLQFKAASNVKHDRQLTCKCQTIKKNANGRKLVKTWVSTKNFLLPQLPLIPFIPPFSFLVPFNHLCLSQETRAPGTNGNKIHFRVDVVELFQVRPGLWMWISWSKTLTDCIMETKHWTATTTANKSHII